MNIDLYSYFGYLQFSNIFENIEKVGMDFRKLLDKIYVDDQIYLFVFNNKSAIDNNNIYEMADEHKQMGFTVIALLDDIYEYISPYYMYDKLYRQPTANPSTFRIHVIAAFKLLRRVKKIIYVDGNIKVLKAVQGEPLTTIYYTDRRIIRMINLSPVINSPIENTEVSTTSHI